MPDRQNTSRYLLTFFGFQILDGEYVATCYFNTQEEWEVEEKNYTYVHRFEEDRLADQTANA